MSVSFTSRAVRVLRCPADILKVIVEDGPASDTISQRRIEDVPVIRKSLVTCEPDTPAAVSLHRAIEANVSALAVIQRETGKIVANLSVSDVRGLAEVPRDSWHELMRAPTVDFIRRMRELSGVSTAVFRDPTGVAVERIVSVRPTDVLGTAVNMLNATRSVICLGECVCVCVCVLRAALMITLPPQVAPHLGC